MTSRTRALGLALAAATTVVLWQFTAGRYLLYPFTILATWFHEMGHGLCAMLLGGSFVSLRLFPDGSGYAVHSGSRFLGQPGLAFIAAAGPLGPALAGALLIFFSLRPKWSRLGLTAVAVLMLLSSTDMDPHAVWLQPDRAVGARAAADPLRGNRSQPQPELAVHRRASLHLSLPEHRLSVHREGPGVRATRVLGYRADRSGVVSSFHSGPGRGQRCPADSRPT
jgi:hypothetical protein